VLGRKWLHGPGDPSDPRAAANYIALARKTVDTLRASTPKATIVVGAVGMDDGWGWTEALLAAGALKGTDGLSVHLYNHCEGDLDARNATQMIDRLTDLKALVSRYNGGQPFPVYVTEFGWPSVSKECGVKPDAIPANMAQMLLWSSSQPWIKGGWIYELKDQGRKADDMEDNFGLVDYDHKPKPAACMVREAARLATENAPSAMARPFRNVFVLVQQTTAGRRLVAWTARDDVHAELEIAGAGALTAKPLCAAPIAAKGTIALGPRPVVVDLPDSASISVTAAGD